MGRQDKKCVSIGLPLKLFYVEKVIQGCSIIEITINVNNFSLITFEF